MSRPKVIETKVIAATAGSGAGAAVGAFVLWLLGVLIWHAPNAAGSAAAAVAAVPAPVTGVTLAALSALGGFVSGYAAPHTPRIDPAAAVAEPVAPLEPVVVEPVVADASDAHAAFTAAALLGNPGGAQPVSPDPYMGGGKAADAPADASTAVA